MPSPSQVRPDFGRNLLRSLPEDLLESPIVLTQPEPWEMVRDLFDPESTQVQMVRTMEHSTVYDVTAAFGPASTVIGVGGGSAMDHAKYVAWRTGLPLVLTPSALSVDAAFTRQIAVREEGRVRYVGSVWPDRLLVDFELLRKAPPLLNRAGSGDILSIFTALWDWRQAHERLGEPYDQDVARQASELLDRLLQSAKDLREGTARGYEELANLYFEEVRLCEAWGNSRPEEGSEHHLAYCIEAMTGRSFLHGQIVSLCVLLAGVVQERDPRAIRRYLETLGLPCSPHAVGLGVDELRAALLEAGGYVQRETELLPGVFHFAGLLSEEDVDRILGSRWIDGLR